MPLLELDSHLDNFLPVPQPKKKHSDIPKTVLTNPFHLKYTHLIFPINNGLKTHLRKILASICRIKDFRGLFDDPFRKNLLGKFLDTNDKETEVVGGRTTLFILHQNRWNVNHPDVDYHKVNMLGFLFGKEFIKGDIRIRAGNMVGKIVLPDGYRILAMCPQHIFSEVILNHFEKALTRDRRFNNIFVLLANPPTHQKKDYWRSKFRAVYIDAQTDWFVKYIFYLRKATPFLYDRPFPPLLVQSIKNNWQKICKPFAYNETFIDRIFDEKKEGDTFSTILGLYTNFKTSPEDYGIEYPLQFICGFFVGGPVDYGSVPLKPIVLREMSPMVEIGWVFQIKLICSQFKRQKIATKLLKALRDEIFLKKARKVADYEKIKNLLVFVGSNENREIYKKLGFEHVARHDDRYTYMMRTLYPKPVPPKKRKTLEDYLNIAVAK